MEHFLKYLHGHHLSTDHSAVILLVSFKNLEGQTTAGLCTNRSTASLVNSEKAENTVMPVPFHDDNAEKTTHCHRVKQL